MTMTKEEYVAKGGNQCPHCGSGELEGDAIQSDSAVAWQEVTCNGCGEIWQDTYQLTGWCDKYTKEPEVQHE